MNQTENLTPLFEWKSVSLSSALAGWGGYMPNRAAFS